MPKHNSLQCCWRQRILHLQLRLRQLTHCHRYLRVQLLSVHPLGQTLRAAGARVRRSKEDVLISDPRKRRRGAAEVRVVKAFVKGCERRHRLVRHTSEFRPAQAKRAQAKQEVMRLTRTPTRKGIQTRRHTDRQKDRQADRQADRCRGYPASIGRHARALHYTLALTTSRFATY